MITNLLSAKQVAEILHVKSDTVYQLKAEGRLPYVKVGKGRCIRFDPKDIEAYIEAQKVK